MRTRPIILGALVVGSVIAMDPKGWSPFGPTKWMVISTLGFAAGGLALWRHEAAVERRSMWLWASLVALVTLSAVTNGDVATAIVGHPDRHLGVIIWLLFWLLFSAGQMLDAAGQRIVLTAAAVAGGLTGAYAVLELAGWNFVDLATTSRRLTGTFGSASFLGAATCLLLPIAAALATDPRRSGRARLVLGSATMLTAVALVGSGARAAWLGLLIAVVAAIVAGGQRQRRPISRRSLVVAAGAAALLAVVLLPRFGDVLERDHGAASRLDEWNVALRVIGDHPILGVGPEGYRIAVAEGLDSHYERTYGRSHTIPDRAHSGPLDVALAGGIPAALIFMILVGLVVSRALRLMRHGDALGRGLAVGVTAYAVQQLFLFPLAEVDPIWWLFAGIVMRTTTSPGPETGADSSSHADEQPHLMSSRRLSNVLGLVALVMAAPALVAGILHVAADRLAKASLESASSGDREAAAENAQRAARLRPDVIAYHLIAADAHLRIGTLEDVDAAIDEARRALRWSADDPLALDQLANSLLQRAVVTGTEVDVSAAFASWQQLVDGDPHRARWQLQLGRAAALAGDVEAARTAWSAADALDPSDPHARELLHSLADNG